MTSNPAFPGNSQGTRVKPSKRPAFSILMSVYRRDNADFLDQALHSVTTKQTWTAREVVLVVDGPVERELDAVIGAWEQQSKFTVRVVRSTTNLGLSRALNLGLQHCRHDYVARMDSDDVSLPDRFEQQFAYLVRNPNVALLGGWYRQYDRALKRWISDRKVPLDAARLTAFARYRTPFNHVTAVFSRSAVLAVGGYPRIDGLAEDWWLALRLIKHGYELRNLPRYLVHVRGDDDFLRRRGGWNYVSQEWANLAAMRRDGLINTGDWIRNLALRTPVRLLPLQVRRFAYQAIRNV